MTTKNNGWFTPVLPARTHFVVKPDSAPKTDRVIVILFKVSEFALFLGKSPQRVYQLVHDGLLDEVGITVYRTRKGRVWLRTIAASSETFLDGRKEA